MSLDYQHNRLLNSPCTWLEQQLPVIQEKFGENLLGVTVFGSRADGTATQNSDVDVLVCLRFQYEISRSLYSWWDERIFHKEFECNPVFSHIPPLERVSSLWYEIALNHKILYDWQNTLESTCAQLMQRVQNGQVQRKWSQGQPYWLLESAR